MIAAPFTPEQWRRIEELFHATLELPEDQRSEFLRRSCGEDVGMRGEIESLLAADDQESPIIAGIVDTATNNLLVDDE